MHTHAEQTLSSLGTEIWTYVLVELRMSIWMCYSERVTECEAQK
jgi:hypothetical protein